MAITIDIEHAAKFVEWFSSRGGVTKWENLEIGGAGSREVFTPADVMQAPHWRYGRPTAINAADVMVNTPTILQTFIGRFKRHYWGPGVADATKRKADRLRDSYKDESVVWVWHHSQNKAGCVEVQIIRESLQPLSL